MQTVLVVDDDRGICEAICAALRRHLSEFEETQVLRAYSGLDTLSIASEQHPSVIVIDLGLPDVDGLKVAQRLRRSPQNQATHIILIAPEGQTEKMEQEELNCIEEIMLRPAKLSDVVSAIQRHLRPSEPSPHSAA